MQIGSKREHKIKSSDDSKFRTAEMKETIIKKRDTRKIPGLDRIADKVFSKIVQTNFFHLKCHASIQLFPNYLKSTDCHGLETG